MDELKIGDRVKYSDRGIRTELYNREGFICSLEKQTYCDLATVVFDGNGRYECPTYNLDLLERKKKR